MADFGFDSVSLTELARLLTGHFGIEITPALFFRYFTLEKLGEFFLGEHLETIQKFYPETDLHPPIKSTASSNYAKVQIDSRRRIAKLRFGEKNNSTGFLEPIAIIGMSGRFPKADTVEEFWHNLSNRKNCITEIPLERWDWRKYDGDPNQEEDKTNCRWGSFISAIDQFDPLFFEISPSEAELMDPQQRLFLEEAWHAFEDAGYMEERIRGKLCGVFVGVEESDYGMTAAKNGLVANNQNATLAARIAYKLDLKGPNLALTAACSSGLVAVHQACQSLRQGECEMALAGGVSLLTTPKTILSWGGSACSLPMANATCLTGAPLA